MKNQYAVAYFDYNTNEQKLVLKLADNEIEAVRHEMTKQYANDLEFVEEFIKPCTTLGCLQELFHEIFEINVVQVI